jgi:hypothetical protein
MYALMVYQYILQIIGYFHLVGAIGSSDSSDDNLGSDPSLAKKTCQKKRQRLKQKQKEESAKEYSNETFDNDDDEEHRYVVKYKKNISRGLKGGNTNIPRRKNSNMATLKNNSNIEILILKTMAEVQKLEEDDNVEYVEKGKNITKIFKSIFIFHQCIVNYPISYTCVPFQITKSTRWDRFATCNKNLDPMSLRAFISHFF